MLLLLVSVIGAADGFQLHSAPRPCSRVLPRYGVFDNLVDGFKEMAKEATVQHVLLPTEKDAMAAYEEIEAQGLASIGRVAQERSECGSSKKTPDAKMSQLRGQPGELVFR